MKYSPQDREEFSKQIRKLLDLKLIIPSKSPHMSPAFLVENEVEKRRGIRKKKSESIPFQTTKGKEKSSPLTPAALEKSKNIVNEELQSSSSPVANGSGKPFPFKRFGSLLQAQQEATRYSAEFGMKEIPLKTTVMPKEEIEDEKDFISLDEFRIVWSKARSLSQDEFEIKHLYTEDKATKSLIICCPGSNPEMVSLAFSTGLIKFIYLSPNLLEISLFPEGMKKASKNFRKKIAAARDANIYIKCTFTLPDLFQRRSYPSYHHLEIGIAKTRTVSPSKVMNKEAEDPENWII
ncbi:hypothetical protein E3N88_28224 [Mikania micrantha]|uniref:Uncharacterized protein n=1 Tax=Mikania micrantha TaxID=192012 RepID=A0A5N6MYX2_9ASTR|nr:hypothetical protein E3N88_28224 [Mikania micrantha]